MLLSFLTTLVLSSPSFGQPAEVIPFPGSEDEEDPWGELEILGCAEKLAEAGLDKKHLSFYKAPQLRSRKISRKETIYCYIPQGLHFRKGPTGVNYYGYTSLSCAMALAITKMEHIAQEEARKIWEFDDDVMPVRAITHYGTYNCRKLRNNNRQSQHSFANAIDIRSIFVRGFGEVNVERHWTPKYRSQEKASLFLHRLSERWKEEKVFTNVLDPDTNRGHYNHFHLDMAPLSDDEPAEALALIKLMEPVLEEEPEDFECSETATPTVLPSMEKQHKIDLPEEGKEEQKRLCDHQGKGKDKHFSLN